jgi:pyruvate dehydrogenase E1 component
LHQLQVHAQQAGVELPFSANTPYINTIPAQKQPPFPYLEDRGLLVPDPRAQVWALLGDGEMDEPEALGAISLAAREKLDNLIFVINCNLQRLDGPVRGNGKIIQELETVFRGAGWNVIKVIWGDDWDPILAKDHAGLLVRRVGDIVDGEYQKYTVASGAYIRQHFFGVDPRLQAMVSHLSDEQLRKMRRGGHDPEKVYAAYQAAVAHKGAPTVILAKTIKGYGLGEHGEGRNVTHKQKILNEDELREFRARFGIPISDADLPSAPFYRPPDESPEIQYLHERRQSLGGYVPQRRVECAPLKTPPEALFEEFYRGTDGRPVSTTMVYVRLLSKLLRDKEIGRLIVPIVPDEARTFGMEALFRQCGIYSHVGQLCEPVDADSLLYYRRPKTARSLRKASPRPAPWRRSLLPGRPALRMGSTPLLLDAWLPAHWRSYLGGSRYALQRLFAWCHLWSHHSGGRRLAASGWA